MASIDTRYFDDLEKVATVKPGRVHVMGDRKNLSCLGVIDDVNTFQRYSRVIKAHGFDANMSTVFITDTAFMAGEDFGELEAFLEVLPDGNFRRWDMDGRLLD